MVLIRIVNVIDVRRHPTFTSTYVRLTYVYAE